MYTYRHIRNVLRHTVHLKNQVFYVHDLFCMKSIIIIALYISVAGCSAFTATTLTKSSVHVQQQRRNHIVVRVVVRHHRSIL
jgi:hypothetical protein